MWYWSLIILSKILVGSKRRDLTSGYTQHQRICWGKINFEFNANDGVEMIIQAILRQQVSIKAAARQVLALAEGWYPWRAYTAMYL